MKNTRRRGCVAGLVACFMLAATSSLLPDHRAQQQPVLVLTHANIIDGESREPIRDATVIIRRGRIEQIVAGTVEALPSATVVDLRGRWVLPGFIDAHVHIGTMAAARTALRSGVTTARSLGVSHFADVGLRELHRAGIADIPDIIAAGYHVRPRPADEFFLDFPALSDLMSGVTGPENVRRMVRALIERGVDTIKIMATERAGLPETDPRKRVYSEEDLVAAVEEARRLGRTVAAHAHGDEGARAAVRAGVRTIEHGTYLSAETLALMRERDTCLVPTIATVIDLTDPGGDYDNPLLAVRGRAMLPRVRETTARAWKMGVRIIAGTDTGYGPASIRRMPHEVIELAALGIPPREAIRAATSVAAACLGVDQRTGTVRPGLEADLIVVDADPLADITALQDILMVINDGVIVLNRLTG
jgi:imidazolonepropionase-like amidohydrolase